jgi:hypothetical protein
MLKSVKILIEKLRRTKNLWKYNIFLEIQGLRKDYILPTAIRAGRLLLLSGVDIKAGPCITRPIAATFVRRGDKTVKLQPLKREGGIIPGYLTLSLCPWTKQCQVSTMTQKKPLNSDAFTSKLPPSVLKSPQFAEMQDAYIAKMKANGRLTMAMAAASIAQFTFQYARACKCPTASEQNFDLLPLESS